MRDIIELNGIWDFFVGGRFIRKIRVPSSYTCVGEADISREVFIPHDDGKLAFLIFEGIAYQGEVYVNGNLLGSMLPYSRYEFDVTAYKGQIVKISAVIRDITAKYGPTGGWEDYGGIIRECFIEYRPLVYIDNTQFISKISDDLHMVSIIMRVFLVNTGPETEMPINVSLSYGNETVWSITEQTNIPTGQSCSEFKYSLSGVRLWSPDYPNLYVLSSSVGIDVYAEHIGFKKFEKRATKFYLNNEPIFLKGVNRHEMWGEQGFTLTDEQVETDLRLMKRMGANYVRLVHYPHSAKTIAAADRLGLLTSEEPGLWWSDLNDAYTTSCANEIMRRVILRDRNRVSVAFWLLLNECELVGAYLISGKKLCMELDPTRMVSCANFMQAENAVAEFDRSDMDFYTQHPYGFDPQNIGGSSLEKMLKIYAGKPTVFTEWGGYFFMNNRNIINQFKRELARLANNPEHMPNLAGMAWWQWQNVYQFYRGLPGCIDGVLSESLVDMDRNKLPMYDVMIEFFDAIEKNVVQPYKTEIYDYLRLSDNVVGSISVPLDNVLSVPLQENEWARIIKSPARKVKNQVNAMPEIGPILREPVHTVGGLSVRLNPGRPIILTERCHSVEIDIRAVSMKNNIVGLHAFGHTTFGEGYPINGTLGEEVAAYTLCYDDGTKDEIPLRNGMEMASSSMLSFGTRIDPIAVNCTRVAYIINDLDWEHYQINHLRIGVNPGKKLLSLIFTLRCNHFTPLLYGVTAELG